MPDEHALLSPSAADRWLRCPASIALGQFKPNTESAYALEGTLAHAVAEQTLNRRLLALEQNKNPADFTTQDFAGYGPASFGIKHAPELTPPLVDDSMVDYIGEYTEGIWVGMTLPGVVERRTEYRVDLSAVMGVENMFGTIDVLIVIARGDAYELQVHDLKYGQGVKVDAPDNKQLMLYALAALWELQIIWPITHVKLFIHQPRLNWESEAELTAEELEDFGREVAPRAQHVDALAAAVRDGATLNEDEFGPDAKACRFCPMSGECKAQAAYIASQISDDFTALEDIKPDNLPRPELADAATLSSWLNVLDLVEGFCKTVQAKAFALLEKGEDVPGYKMIRGRPGNRAWSSKDDAEAAMKAMRLKKDDMYSISVISPTQAEKLLAKSHEQQWQKLQPLITRGEGKLQIAPLSHKSPAVKAGDDFSNLN